MKKVLCLAWIFILCGGCGRYCYRGSCYQLPQTNLCQAVDEVKGSKVFFEKDFFAEENWWNFFQDPMLSHFIELGLSCHPDIAIADARIRWAVFEAERVKAKLYPHAYLFGAFMGEKFSELSTDFVPGLPSAVIQATLKLTNLTYELDLWKKNRASLRAALDESYAQIAELEQAKLMLSTTIAAFYFDWQTSLRRLEVAQDWLKAKEEIYSLLEDQFRAEIVSAFRLYETDTEVQLLKDLIFQIQARIEIDKHALFALVGNLGCECIDLGFAPVASFCEFPLPCSLPIELLSRRPDIVAKRWIIEAQDCKAYAAKARFYPRIDLLSFIGFKSVKLDRLFSGKAFTALGEATGLLPLFTAGQLTAELGQAREEVEIAIQEYNQNVLNAVQEVSDALTTLVITEERRESLLKSIQDAEKLLKLTELQYTNAIANKIAVLSAKENIYLQKELEIRIELARLESALSLIKALGGGYHDGCRGI